MCANFQRSITNNRGMGIRLEVNGREIMAEKGETILTAIRRNGMDVPTICNLEELSPTGACRMCVVEVEGRENLVTACSFPVEEELIIRTHSPRVLHARKTNLELLLSSHPDDCLYCERNRMCELQSLAEELNIRQRRIPSKIRSYRTDRSSPAIARDPAKCILCGRCVRVCEEIMATSTLDFAGRGNELRISTSLGMSLDDSNCTSCGQCLNACPTAALVENTRINELEPLLHDPKTFVMVQVAPQVAVSLGEMFGFRPGADMGSVLNALLRRLGFGFITGTALGADLMVLGQTEIFREMRLKEKQLPLVTSSCPAWLQYCETNLPEWVPHLSPLRSPAQITGVLMKTRFAGQAADAGKNIVSVLVTSCTAAKKEAVQTGNTLSGKPVIDLVLTTRELARLIRTSGLDPEKFRSEEGEPGTPDESAARLTAVAGGEAELAARTIYFRETGQELDPSRLQRFRIQRSFREATLEKGKYSLKIGAVSGLSNVVALLDEIRRGEKQLDLLEVMACPEGCVNGGGQPLGATGNLVRARTRAIYDQDNSAGIRTAHGNRVACGLRGEFLEKQGGETGLHLLLRSNNLYGRTGHEA